MSLSLGQQKALAVIPKVTGLLSFASSATIIAVILRTQPRRARNKRRNNRVYHRLLVGMSIADISSSLWLSLSTWPIPKESGTLWAVGNATTCTFQGFFTQFGISSPIYNVSLSIYYLLVIRYSWKEQRLIKIEKYLQALPILWAGGTAIAGLFLNLFHSANLWCWVAPDPEDSNNANVYRWAFFYGPLWLSIIVVTINLVLVFLHVRNVTHRSERYSIVAHHNSKSLLAIVEEPASGKGPPEASMITQSQAGSESAIERSRHDADVSLNDFGNDSSYLDAGSASFRRESGLGPNASSSSAFAGTPFSRRRRQVAYRCLRYAMAFYYTWIPITLVRILQTVGQPPIFALLILAAMNTPMQGLPNFLAYLLPMYLSKPVPPTTARPPAVHANNHNAPCDDADTPGARTETLPSCLPTVKEMSNASSTAHNSEADPPPPDLVRRTTGDSRSSMTRSSSIPPLFNLTGDDEIMSDYESDEWVDALTK